MQLASFPRRHYTDGRTPLEPLHRLSAHLGGPKLFIKRDDMLGLAGGGNKTRKLEFLVADALKQGADTLVTAGAVQSNHCRLALAAANREGMRCRLVLEERVSGSYDRYASGNNLLYHLLGADKTRVVAGGADIEGAMEELAAEVEAEGGRAYIVPGGGSTALGALGYVACAQEILGQLFEQGIRIDHVVCASGSGATHAGMVAGMRAFNSGIAVTGISTRFPRERQEARVRALAREVTDLLEVQGGVPDAAVSVFDEYVGDGHALPTEGMVEAVQMMARLEAILLDPVYTGKVMAGLIDLIRRGQCGRDENVLFLHTGGVPALYAFQHLWLD